LAAPFKPKDADLFSIISGFDAAYSAYNAHQAAMERFWTLKYVAQQGITELVGSLFKENLVRAEDIPLVLPVMGAKDLPRGARLRIQLGGMDEVSLDISGTVVERLDLDARTPGDSSPDTGDAGDEDGEAMAAGPIAIAVDMDDASSPAGDPTAP
jgi:exoribonuclease-2